ncbi:hypothetical protein L1987_46330 [Smallanthus sonchifolius]|uniref:Uncharacterized protein n=1 Tax=Smallanthus sonchifolius TaxID=185202 RepID=A0ACB9FYW0_9ASTR|nr:hypothetical protein L1987_46330 [Smallanthus sonchifolius]
MTPWPLPLSSSSSTGDLLTSTCSLTEGFKVELMGLPMPSSEFPLVFKSSPTGSIDTNEIFAGAPPHSHSGDVSEEELEEYTDLWKKVGPNILASPGSKPGKPYLSIQD